MSLKSAAVDWKGWTLDGLRVLERALRRAQTEARARAEDRRLAHELELREKAAGVTWPGPKETT